MLEVPHFVFLDFPSHIEFLRAFFHNRRHESDVVVVMEAAAARREARWSTAEAARRGQPKPGRSGGEKTKERGGSHMNRG